MTIGFTLLLIDLPFVKLSKPVNGPMKQNAKVVAIHTKIVTNLFVIAIFKETRLQQMPVPFGERSQDRADLMAVLFLLDQFFQPRWNCRNSSGLTLAPPIQREVNPPCECPATPI